MNCGAPWGLGIIQTGYGFGETWAKMLMMTVDIAYPEKQLLGESCDVGIGARQGLRRLVAVQEPRKALQEATSAMNASKLHSARCGQ